MRTFKIPSSFTCFFVLVSIIPIIRCDVLLIDELIGSTKSYDRRIRPYSSVGLPVNVSVHITVAKLGPINEQDMTMEISYYFRQYWTDPRLVLNGSIRSDIINTHPKNIIWIPDIKVSNAIELEDFDSYTRTIIKSNGHMYFSQRLRTKTTCNMELFRFPMDTQMCHIQLESYAFNQDHLRLSWRITEITVPKAEEMALTGYKFIEVKRDAFKIKYGSVDIYDNLFAYFIVKRTFEYYLTKAFVPTILLVLFNIGSYWIPDTAEPARVTLIITTFLASMLILQSVTEETVKVPYATSMQVFMIVNIIFLMVAILQYIVILSLRAKKKKKSLKESQKENGAEIQNSITKNSSNDDSVKLKGKESDGVHILDEIFRILMPICYVIFCVSYFSYYLIH